MSLDPRGMFSPTAIVDHSATFADDATRVWHFALVLPFVRIGKMCSIGARAEIGRGSIMGDRTRISAGVFLPPCSQIGASVFIGPNVTFTDDMFPRVPEPGDPPYDAQPPIVGDHASIGAGAIILPGIRIGHRARVAAGAIVTEDVPDDAMVLGVPARQRPVSEGWKP